ncbi:girdin-like [Mytilus californianus]|uniref:girdin-like n=1 Tax=Mytilus californianus TaxID=6549 RepID=UPI002246479C|nr:girdin-like [Mytilus californianus]XP_052068678.1 girdin-like [Mytilus californianus]XP_052068679.1 girdin-like [Mytilus californianus]
MEKGGRSVASNFSRQETFETDSRFTARSKSGSVKRGDLSLPVIGPRHLVRQNSADRIQNKHSDRVSSPEAIFGKGIHSDRTYTTNLLEKSNGDFPDEKAPYKLRNKKYPDISEDTSYVKESILNEQKKSVINKQVKEKRKVDTKSVESGDSSKENKIVGAKESPVKEVKTKSTNASKNDNSLKENKITEKNTASNESKFNDKKVLNSSAVIKERKSNENKPLDKAVTVKERKINDRKPVESVILRNESKNNDKKTLVNTNSSNKFNEQKDIKPSKRETSVDSNVPQLKQLKRTIQEKSNDKASKEKSSDPKLGKRETLRDKLTSTPISDYTSNTAARPVKTNKSSVSKVQIKETKAIESIKKEESKRLKENLTQTTKTTSLKSTQKVENKVVREQLNLKSESKLSRTQTTETVDRKYEETKRNRLKNINKVGITGENSTSKKVSKDTPTYPKQDIFLLNERRPSSDSFESGFASYRQSDNRREKVEDVISLLTVTDTEVGKPPENTVLDRPRSDKSRVSFRSEQGPTDKFKGNHLMEPVVQRKPGSERMTESYESIYEERRTLLEAEGTYRKRIKQLEDEMNQFLKTIDDLRSENRALRNRIDSLENSENSGGKRENEQLNLTIQSLQAQNKVLESKHDKTEAKIAKLEKEKDKLTSENNDLTSKLTDLQVKYSKVDNDLAKLRLEQNSDSTKFDKEFSQLRNDLKTEQSERKKLEDQITILKTDKDVLKDEVVALRSLNKNLEAINEEFKNENITTGELPNKEKMELKSQIITLQTDNQTLNEENIRLKAENLKQVKSIHDLEKTAKSFESSVTAVESSKMTEIQDLQNENAKLKSEIKDLKETHADANNKIKSLESENKDLDETLSQKKVELSELLTALKDDDKFDSEIKNLRAENARLKTESEEKDKKADDSGKHLEEIKIEKDKFETEKNKLTKKINEMLEMNEEQKKHMADLQEKLEFGKREIESNKEKLKQIEKYENELSDLKSKLQNTEKERDRLIKQKQEEIDDLKLKMERNDVNHKEQLDALKMEYEKEIDELKKQVDFLQKEIEELRQLKAVESELLETNDELMKVKEKYSQMVSEVESKSDLEQKNFQMNMRMTQMNNTIKLLERDKKEWLIKKQEFDEIEANNKRLQDENIGLKQRGGIKKVSKQIDKQIEFLERKQKDAETRVKQLEGWVGDLYDDDESQNRATYVGSLNGRKAPPPKKKQPFTKASKPPKTTIRIDHDRPRSLDDVEVREKDIYEKRSEKSEKFSHSSTPSLPAIEPETRLTFGLGYSQIHRSRIKAAQKYRK